ncbi:MAG: SpaH/EbpB family LPXTG-anchored major pilin [Ruminococcus sp.]|nr:SpaH/EbpB family LPXTG-anchored major pilin [Ruminococcus sp.]
MKKTRKMTAALLLSSMMAASTCAAVMNMTAAAADPTYTITIDGATGNNDASDHTYYAYQIMTGTVTDDDEFENAEWGEGIDGAGFLTELSALDDYSTCTTLGKFLEKLDKVTDDSDAAQEIAAIMAKHLVATKKISETDDSFADLPGGYYLIQEDTSEDLTADPAARTRLLLQLTKDTTLKVAAKKDVPTIDKKIVDGASEVTGADFSIGDTVNYKLTTKVPDMEGYNKYYFNVEDTMEKGLTFDPGSVVVQIAGDAAPLKMAEDAAGTGDYYVKTTTNTDKSTTITIVFKDFIENQSKKGKAITITYNAILNDQAVLYGGNDGNDAWGFKDANDNKVKLVFSNDPTYDYDGESAGDDTPDEPDSDSPMGKTPEKQTHVYTTGVRLHKISSLTKESLKGAVFEISGSSVSAVITNGRIYSVSDTGTYYMLNDGTFTTTAPTDATKDKYVDTTKKYALVDKVTKDTDITKLNKTAVSDSDGIITFDGLGAGEYTITELAAPDGYNKLKAPIVFTIEEPTFNSTTGEATFTAKKGSTSLSFDEDNLEFSFEVENNKGILLPGTGGIGTTLFYLTGSLFLAGGVSMYFFKKKNGEKE